jgi:hypothetical protein
VPGTAWAQEKAGTPEMCRDHMDANGSKIFNIRRIDRNSRASATARLNAIARMSEKEGTSSKTGTISLEM